MFSAYRPVERLRHGRRVAMSPRQFFALPALGGYRVTARRRLNLYLNRLEYLHGRTRLRSYPTRLVVEPASACNLRCPYCLTGAGEIGRPRRLMTLELYGRLLDELGPYLFELEAFHWGEPLLNPHLEIMIAAASQRGIATTVNTNLSVAMDRDRAERLVGSGLTELTVSVDGVEQATYEQYRVRGDLDRVLDNCRLLTEARQRLGTSTRLVLEFHVFPHNVGDVPAVHSLAREVGMTLRIFKGVVPGPDWDVDGRFDYCVAPIPVPCIFLWGIAVVSTDAGVLPCRGAFRAADDFGRLAMSPADLGAASFRDVWNGTRFITARRFYARRDGDAHDRAHICFDCPNTVTWERWRSHVAAGGRRETFDVGYTLNGIWNYFWERGRAVTTARP